MKHYAITLLIIQYQISVDSFKLNNYLTPEESMSIFQTPIDSVPEHEVVPVAHKTFETSNQMNGLFSVVFTKVFGSDLRLYLEPSDGILAGKHLKLWTAKPDKSSPGGIEYTLVKDLGASKTIRTYQDVSKKAAVTVDLDDSGNLMIDGMIGPDLIVKPIPIRLKELATNSTKHKRQANFLTQGILGLAEDVMQTIPHVVFKHPTANVIESLPENIIDLMKERVSRFVPPKGGFVYPEIMVFMDRALYEKLGNDTKFARKYVLSFWNGVDLRYRLLGDPSVRLNIAGIIISVEDVPFITNNIVKETMIDADQTLLDIGRYLYENKTFVHGKDYDIFFTMTGLDMCNYDELKSSCLNQAMGYAYTASACSINETSRMVNAIGMAEDNGGFKSIIPNAHEIGHLLGATHDHVHGGKDKCDTSDGYIMASGFAVSENGFEWSPCSMEDFTKYLNGPDSKCLRNKPEPDTPLPRYLPGLFFSLEQQCQKLFNGSYPCNVDETVCLQLQCHIPEANFCQPYYAAAEGSPCGDKLFCVNGKCIPKSSIEVPRPEEAVFSR